MIPDVKIMLSPNTGLFYHQEDYETLYLEKGYAPICHKNDPQMEFHENDEENLQQR